MEDTLREYVEFEGDTDKGLNPCSNGRYSQSKHSKNSLLISRES